VYSGPKKSRAAVRREVQSNVQQDLERERADLLSKNAMLDSENKQLHDYINNHLAK
jgi:hypothetical protein